MRWTVFIYTYQAKERMRRDRKLGRMDHEVPAKGAAMDQRLVDAHTAGVKKKQVTSYRRSEQLAYDDRALDPFADNN